jgi:Ser/Thr protein kinase RdoA (MazF antagonist)
LSGVLTLASGPAVAEAFGLAADATLTGPVARGEQGQVWRFDVGGSAYAVKDPFVEVDPDEAEADADYQDVVHAAGVPMPALLRTPDGRALTDVDGGPVRLYEWVDVLPRDRRLDPVEVGRVVARIHQVVVPADEPMADWYVAPVGAERWHGLVDDLRGAGAPFAADLDRLVPELLAVERVLTPVRGSQWCHLDLWADNLLPTPGGRLVVLDWENSGPGDPTQELGLVLFDLGGGDPARIAALHAAYVEAGGPGRVTAPSDLTVVVAQLGHIAELGCHRWLASETDAERAHNEGWVREFLDEPLTLGEVEKIVASAGQGVSSPRRS